MRNKPDHYSLRAKKEGYLARSVYKLLEIDKKFSLIKKGQNILDLGAAPGSWCQYTQKKMQKTGHITAVDLKPLMFVWDKKIITFIQGSFLENDVSDRITDNGPYDLILSDAAPSTSGNRFIDTQRSLELVRNIVALSDRNLKEGGNLTVKIFQGGEENLVIEELKKTFQKVKIFKPEASRKESFEVFLIAISKRTKPN
jgi:23S rRNA (uridine2552-2'-O)-methyltransferase